MSLVIEVIQDALADAGVFDPEDSIPAEEGPKCLRKLNDLFDRWSMQGLTVFVRSENTKVLTVGTGSYTIGSGCVIDTVKPIEIDQAFLRDSSSNDLPIDCSMTQGEYNAISTKTSYGIPKRLYYHKSFPVGIIYFDYLPSVAYTLYLFSKKQFTAFDDINADFSAVFPPGYKSAITSNLAVDLAEFYKRTPSQLLVTRAVTTLQLIKGQNYEPKKLGLNSCPGVQGASGSIETGWR